MQTHKDEDFKNQLLERLSKRAEKMVQNKQSIITAGKEGEKELASWKHNGIQIRHLPDDEDNVTRISIGGHPKVETFSYCVIRGTVGDCIKLLERSIEALKKAP